MYRKALKSFWKCATMLVIILLINSEIRRQKRSNLNIHLPTDIKVTDLSLNIPTNNTFMNSEDKRVNYGVRDAEDLPILNYFRRIKTPTGVCRKLVRLGGELQCRFQQFSSPLLDGDKVICVDPEMEIFSSWRTEDCTVLSFGISIDPSFDLSIRDANCQVHMFDILNFNPKFNETFMTFHEIGLSSENVFLFADFYNKTVEVNTLDYLISKLNLSTKLINVLKVNIEGAEWKVFDYLTRNDLLTSVGQISVEVHVFDALKNKKTAEENIKNINKVLWNLENAGFRKIVYYENPKAETVKDELGNEHINAGELLLVNSNWYKR